MDSVNISVMVRDKVINVSVQTDTNWVPTDESVSLRVQTVTYFTKSSSSHQFTRSDMCFLLQWSIRAVSCLHLKQAWTRVLWVRPGLWEITTVPKGSVLGR